MLAHKIKEKNYLMVNKVILVIMKFAWINKITSLVPGSVVPINSGWESMQLKIQCMQDSYDKLLKILPLLIKDPSRLTEAKQLVQQLDEFYQSSEWLELYDRSEEFNIDTRGNYSVLSEDAIWNVLSEFDRLTSISKRDV